MRVAGARTDRRSAREDLAAHPPRPPGLRRQGDSQESLRVRPTAPTLPRPRTLLRDRPAQPGLSCRGDGGNRTRAEVRDDDPELSSHLRIEERQLETGSAAYSDIPPSTQRRKRATWSTGHAWSQGIDPSSRRRRMASECSTTSSRFQRSNFETPSIVLRSRSRKSGRTSFSKLSCCSMRDRIPCIRIGKPPDRACSISRRSRRASRNVRTESTAVGEPCSLRRELGSPMSGRKATKKTARETTRAGRP